MSEITLCKCKECGIMYPEDEKHRCNILVKKAYQQGRVEGIDEFLEQCKTLAVRGVFSPISPQGCERYVFDDGMYSVWLDDIENLAEQLKEQTE